MAEPFWNKTKARWYLRYHDAVLGKWRSIAAPKDVTTKGAAKIAQRDLESRHDRMRRGFEPLPTKINGTVGELLAWWLKEGSTGTASHDRNEATVLRHLVGIEGEPPPPIASAPLTSLAAVLRPWLKAKTAEGYAPQTVNHLREFVSRAWSLAIRESLLPGPNPIEAIEPLDIGDTAFDYLRFHEVSLVLRCWRDESRPMAATAIYAGLRKGELFALTKPDVDLEFMTLRVAKSHGRKTTKAGRTRYVPINQELVPYLRAAIDLSPSDLVFPNLNERLPKLSGKQRRFDQKMAIMLRRAMGRAGLVESVEYYCNPAGAAKRAPGYSPHPYSRTEKTVLPIRPRCPVCASQLQSRKKIRPITFHQLRHTTASLLLMAGADLFAVSRILGHSSYAVTERTYGHMAQKYLRTQVNKLSLLKASGFASPLLPFPAAPV